MMIFFVLLILVARHRIDRRHRTTQQRKFRSSLQRCRHLSTYLIHKRSRNLSQIALRTEILETSGDISRCFEMYPETSRLAKSSLVKCTIQSMCPCALTPHASSLDCVLRTTHLRCVHSQGSIFYYVLLALVLLLCDVLIRARLIYL